MLIDKLMKFALLGSEWVLYLLILLSIASIATMVERFIYFFRRRGEAGVIRSAINETLGRGAIGELEERLAGKRSVHASVVRVALHWLASGPEALADGVDAELAKLRPELERGSNLLGTLGNNAPFVGLFGTVLGVIIAFDALGNSGGNAGEMGAVMAGIAEALVSTGVGLFVALPAVVAYNLVQKRVGEIESDCMSLVKLMTAYAKGDPQIVRRTQELRDQRGTVARLRVTERGDKSNAGDRTQTKAHKSEVS